MLTVAGRVRVEIDPAKGSRFIATAAPAADETAARQLVEELRAEMPDATHHCSAWRIAQPSIDRANDDGEPSGSAGRPILNQLVGRNVVDACIVVTRYFGGTKLGVGGLVRAYGKAAGHVLDSAVLTEHRRLVEVTIEHGYEDGSAVEQALEAHEATTSTVDYGARIVRTVLVSQTQLAALDEQLKEATSGRVTTRRSSSPDR